MLVVGELINSSIKRIGEAIERKDREFIVKVAREQQEAGADYIDANAATTSSEEDNLEWLVSVIQDEIDAPLCLDSTNPEALRRALRKHRGSALVNSVSLEKGRMENILPLVKEYDADLVALCMSDEGIPDTAARRLEMARRSAAVIQSYGISLQKVYYDPLVIPVSVNPRAGAIFLDALEKIANELPDAGTICGLSNISHGLPAPRLINETFLVLALGKGLKGAIINPLDDFMMSLIKTGEMLTGQDHYCKSYLRAFRRGKIVEQKTDGGKRNGLFEFGSWCRKGSSCPQQG